MLAADWTPLNPATLVGETADKPQSKVWSYGNAWWSVFSDTDGAWVWRLDGSQWTRELKLDSGTNFRADVKPVGDVAHILLYGGTKSKLASVQYVPGETGSYQMWSTRPEVVDVRLSSGVEVATLDLDSTGRLWIASDAASDVEVRSSVYPYAIWSKPVVVGSGITSDDIATITALPGNQIGVLWSDQNAREFRFRVHADGDDPSLWSTQEVPAPVSTSNWLNVGMGIADDHLNIAAASDGTLYVAVKTSLETSDMPTLGLLVRRPSGTWDPQLYAVDTSGTRPIVVLNEQQQRLIVLYTDRVSGGDIVYRESPLSSISFGPRQTLLAGSPTLLNDVTSTKQVIGNELVVIAGGGGRLAGAIERSTPLLNQPPVVYAGADRRVVADSSTRLRGSVFDDGLAPGTGLSATWSKISGPGTVSFFDANAHDTLARFSQAGTYVLRLTGADGQYTAWDEVTYVVDAASPTITVSFQDGVLPQGSYAGTRDAKVKSSDPAVNFGQDTNLEADGLPEASVLMGWDLSTLPVNSTVASASITLYVSNATNHGYKLYELLRNWDENQATWEIAANGQAWDVPGVLGAGDRGNVALGQIAQVPRGFVTLPLNDAGVALVENWIRNPASNYGLVVQDYSSKDGLDFNSREEGLVQRRPKLTIEYRETNRPPQLATIGDRSVNEGTQVQFTVSATDPDGDLLTYDAHNLPEGATFDPSTRTFTWTPAENQDGAQPVTFSVSDGQELTWQTVTIDVAEVNQAPVIDPIADKSVDPGSLLSFTVTARDPDLVLEVPNTLTYSASGLPSGATFDAGTREFRWTPTATQGGIYHVTFSVSDGAATNSATVTIVVDRPPVLQPIGSKTVDEDNLLQFEISATDPDGDPITYSAGPLPSGAAFDAATRTFRWTPSESQDGSYSVTFTASDGLASTSETVSILVREVNQSPALAPIGDRAVAEHDLLSFTISASDADLVSGSPNTLAYAASGLPAGATFDPSTRTFRWTPGEDQDGTHAVTFSVNDGTETVSETIRIAVSEMNRPPVLNPVGNKSVAEKSLLSFTVSATDPDLVAGVANPLSYSASGLPPGANFDVSTRQFQWTPAENQDGTHQLTLTVSDGNASASETITITVAEVNEAPTLNAIGNKAVFELSTVTFVISGSDPDLVGGQPNTLTFAASNLPAGASFDASTRQFQWTPAENQDGTHSVTFSLHDGSATRSETITITVNEVNQPPTLEPIGDKVVSAGAELAFLLRGNDGDLVAGVPNTLAYSASDMPSGAALDAGTGQFRWTPTAEQVGTHTVSFSVSDGAATATRSMTITVEAAATATTISFQDGVWPSSLWNGTRDATIKSGAATSNFGGEDKLLLDGLPDQGVLIRWDVSSIPAGSKVTSASIVLNVTNPSNHVYDIFAMARPWVESQVTWSEASAGVAWATAGALGTADRDPTLLAQLGPVGRGTASITLNAAGLAAVERWIADAGNNHGILLQEYDRAKDGVDLDSREADVAANRPKLVITYEPILDSSGSADSDPARDPRDVNADGSISSVDVLLVFNELNRPMESERRGLLPNSGPPHLDVTGDGRISPADALPIINYLNALSADASERLKLYQAPKPGLAAAPSHRGSSAQMGETAEGEAVAAHRDDDSHWPTRLAGVISNVTTDSGNFNQPSGSKAEQAPRSSGELQAKKPEVLNKPWAAAAEYAEAREQLFAFWGRRMVRDEDPGPPWLWDEEQLPELDSLTRWEP